ncbi:hypothetical protein CHH28_01120 [Bacterioplanes sanyensis]|uniref:Uncharacterized protein n=2 Tax=Bacterioplanes sanyensis TaxID=1249553 RepID=A0A222FFL4_9GAMM|nr:hypothetical protein CHH28_01120 [Bacterioplanes sanyensis]
MGSQVAADTVYRCIHKDQQRLISVVYLQPGQTLPCEVRYQKQGHTETLWRADQKAGFCEQQAQAFVDKQQNWGWLCQQDSTADSTQNTPLQEQVLSTPSSADSDIQDSAAPEIQDSTGEVDASMSAVEQQTYQRSARFSALFHAIMPIRLKAAQFTHRYGQFPSDLTELDLSPALHDNRKLEQVIIDNGIIIVDASQFIGEPARVRMIPNFAAGGSYIRWQCSTNLELSNQDICALEPGLVF